LVGVELCIVIQFSDDLLVECNQNIGVIGGWTLRIEIPHWNDDAVGAESASELGFLAEIQLATCCDACQSVEQCGFVFGADPTDVSLAAWVDPPNSAWDVCFDFV